MSGLVSFFQDDNDELEDNNNNHRHHHIDATTTTVAYEESTLDLARRTKLRPETTQRDGAAPGKSRACETGELSYQEWSSFQKEWIISFMQQRLFDKSQESSRQQQAQQQEQPGSRKRPLAACLGRDTNDSNSNEDDPASQPPHVPSFGSIPHIHDTLHSAVDFGDLNLTTKHVEFAGRLVLQKIWPFRLTRRPAVLHALPRTQVIYTFPPNLLRMSLDPCIDDGPLGMVYRSVISLEVTQQQQQQQRRSSQSQEPLRHSTSLQQQQQQGKQQLRQLAVAAMSELGPPRVRRLQIFLYNKYAKAFNSILPFFRRRQASQHQLQLQLEHVPPASIIPNGAAMSDWFQRHDASLYCLCFGDYSLMNVLPGEEDRNNNASTTTNTTTTTKNKKIAYRFDGRNTDETIGRDNVDGTGEAFRIRVFLVSTSNGQVLREWEISSQHPNFIVETTVAATTTPLPLDHTTNPALRYPPMNRLQQPEQEQAVVNHPGAMVPEPPNVARRSHAFSTVPIAAAQEPIVAGRLGTQADRNREKFHYLSLRDLEQHYESHTALAPTDPFFANIYGVALGFNSPSRTKRGDWMMSIALVDESIQIAAASTTTTTTTTPTVPAVALNAFAKLKCDLPDVKYCGDVVRIHRARVQKWKEDMQLMGSRGTSYLVFRKDVWPASHANWVVRSPSKKCSVSDDDESRFFQLWNWGQDRILSQPTIKPDHAWTLADFAAVGGDDNDREEGDLTVMVTTMVKWHDQSTIAPVGLLRIWDGTGAPTSEAYPIAVVSSSHNNNNETAPAVDEGDPPPEAMLRLSHVVSELRGRVQQQQNLSIPEAVTGRVANALIWEESHWELLADTVKPGSFVRLRNVKLGDLPGSANGQRCLMVSVKTHLTPLPSMTYEVVRLIERHDKRLKRKEPLNPDSGVLPLSWNDGGAHHADPMGGPSTTTVSPHNTNWGTEIVSTLAELVASPGSACFSGVVRISDTVPSIHSASDSALESKLRSANEGIGLRLEQQEQQQGVNEDDSAICFIDVIVGLGSSSAEVLLIALSEKVPFQGKVVSRLRQSIIQKGHWMATVYGIVYEGSRYFQLDKLEALQSYADL